MNKGVKKERNMFTQHFIRSASSVLVLAGFFSAHSACAAVYAVKDLGILTDLPARNGAKPNAISSDGKIAAANATNGNYRAFLYDGGWTNLGTLGGTNSFAFGVNLAEEVVGRSLISNGLTRAFLWTPGGTNG